MKAEFEVEVATPMSIGGAEPDEVDRLFYIRPSSLKGVWRWWARAFAAGAYYQRGWTGADLLRQLPQAVGEAMGLGTTGRASAYTLRISVLDPPQVRKTQRRAKTGIQRLDLLSLNREVEYIERGRFRIAVEGDHPAFDAAVAVLAVALTLQGLGKGGRKAMGTLDITAAHGRAPRGTAGDLIKEAARRVEEVVKPRQIPSKPQGLPPIASVAPGVFEVYAVDASFRDIHGFFLRARRGQPDPLHGYSWFLGLPRAQRGTGYEVVDREVNRRASPVFAAAHGRGHIYGGGTYLSVFLSADWPRELRWRGGSGQRTIKIDEGAVRAARDKLLAAISRFRPRRIW